MQIYIKVPDPITLLNLETGGPILSDEKKETPEEPWDISHFFVRYIFSDPLVSEGRSPRAAGQFITRVRAALKAIKDGVLLLDEPDRLLVKQILNQERPKELEKRVGPMLIMHPMITSQLESFICAIEEGTPSP